MKYAESQKRRRLRLKMLEIEDSVNVTISNGTLYITCNGNVVSKIDNEKTIDYVLMEIENIKEAKMSYENIGNRICSQ